ncbi:hypothetical protein Btru_073618 [Bulinus truncatus]|nr:hypothetical protein Btru_073618 [Bulinus truncatus]
MHQCESDCDPGSPKKVPFEKVIEARKRIGNNVVKTPCKFSKHLSEMFRMEIYLKMENEQVTGSFKDRGAFNSIQAAIESCCSLKGVISASAGNHAIALANAGHNLNVPVTVVMPTSASQARVEACLRSRAEVILHGRHIGEAKVEALELARQKGYKYINGYDHPDVISGQGTLALEILEEVENVDVCVVPTGGGGLLAGVCAVAAHVSPRCKIIGVESEASTGFAQALAAGQPVNTPVAETLAHGLAVPMCGVNALETVKVNGPTMLTIRESSLVKAILSLLEFEKTVAEGAGVAGVAALMEGLLSDYAGKKVVIIITGGNIDTTTLGDIIHRGLEMEKRLVRFQVSVSDLSSGLSTLSKVVTGVGCSLKDITKEIMWHSHDCFTTVMKVLVETRNIEHYIELRRAIEAQFSSSCFGY